MMTDSQCPDFPVVSVKLLNSFELEGRMLQPSGIKVLARYSDLVTVPVLQHLVFANCPEIVRALLKCDLHNTFFVSED